MRRSLPVLLCLLALLLAWSGRVAAEEEDDLEPKSKRAAWSVAEPGGPYRTIELETTQGTWMSVDVHPDGTRLVFDLLGDIYTLPIEGGEATRLTQGLPYDIQPRWSPDGKTILFTSDRGGGDNIWVMDADGRNPAPVTEEEFRLLNNAVWHPSGDYIIAKKHFTSRRSLGAGEMWMYAWPKGGQGVQLTKRKNDQQDVGEPAISPDGRFLYWSEDMSGGTTFQYNKDPHGIIYVIRRLDMETGEVRDLIRRPGGAVRPVVSPDGHSLAFVRRRDRATVLALYNLQTGRVRDLWDGLSRDQQETWAIFGPYPGFAWMPDGSAIVVAGQGRLHRVDPRTGQAREIPFRARVQQRICETRRIEHTVGGDTFDVKVIRWPQLTADGRTAVFQALGHLYRRDLASGRTNRITRQTAEHEFAPWLTPDGRAVVYTTWHDTQGGRVRMVNLDGTGSRTLVDWPGHYASAALTPDGREVVFHRAGPDRYRGSLHAEDEGIYLQKLEDGAKPRFLRRTGRKPRFTDDGRRVWLIESRDQKTHLVSVDRIGSDRRVAATSERAVDFEVSPDGRWLAFEELWQTYVLPLPPTPTALQIGPRMRDLPVRRLSRHGGTYLSFSPDGGRVRWSLGPEMFEAEVAPLFARDRLAAPPKRVTARTPVDERGVGAPAIPLGWAAPADVPATDVYLVGGRVAPMHDERVIEDGVVHVRGNRIVAVGPRAGVPVPEGATVIDVTGHTVMPGFVDTHSHTGASNHGLYPQQSWAFLALLAFGVTTVHDPSNNTQMIYAESELVRAGQRLGPRVLSTGTILYGAEGRAKAVINGYEDALQEVRRTTAWGPRSVKSYQQPRREQRQQVIQAARALGIMVMPEGGSTLHYNITHLLDGHTTLEHAIPVAPLYEPALQLLSRSGTCYTPTLVVGYGGFWGENYWYAKTNVWEHERLLRFVPRTVVMPNARRRTLLTDEQEYNHIRLARTCAEVYRRGGPVTIGAHGQLQGLGSHWEAWMLEQGGLTAHQALRCATWCGAQALCLEHEIGSLQPGNLADLIVVAGDPLANVRDSERVRYTMVGGRLYDAATMAQILPRPEPLPPGPPLDTIRAQPGHVHCACGR